VAPDVDALGLVAELLTRNSGNSLTWWSDYHHVHKVGFGLVAMLFAFWLAIRITFNMSGDYQGRYAPFAMIILHFRTILKMTLKNQGA